MENHLHITTTLDQPILLKNLVEKLACRRYDIGFGQALVPASEEAIEQSSAETYVSGTVALSVDEEESIHIPFISRFLFTCVKGGEDPYQLAWSMSLS